MMGSNWRFITQSLLFSFLTCHMSILSSTFVHLAVPLMSLYNKTSGELFGIYDGGTLFLSICSWCSTLSIMCSLVFIVPLMDWGGRKFVSVYLKSLMSFFAALFMISAWYFQSAIFYVCGFTLTTLATTATSIADPTYIAELASEEHRDNYLKTCSTTIPTIVSSMMMLVLSRVDVFGTDDSWWIIIVISQVFNLLFFVVGSRMESTKNLRKSSSLTKFLRGHSSKFPEVLRDWSNLKMVLLLVGINALVNVSSFQIEAFYPLQMYDKEGLSANEVLTMNLITEVISLPYYWVGPIALDKLSRKTFLIVVEVVFLLKAALHLANIEFQTLYLAYPNSILHRLLNGCGIVSLSLIMISEVLPKEYIVVGGQLAMAAGTVIYGITSSIIPFLLAENLPLLLICFTTIGVLIFWVLMQLLPDDAEELPEKKKLLP